MYALNYFIIWRDFFNSIEDIFFGFIELINSFETFKYVLN